MEQYVKQPAEVEVFDLGGQTDIILRRDIQQTQQPLEDGGTQTIWTCEERQHRVPGSYTAEDVTGLEVKYLADGEKYVERIVSQKASEAAAAHTMALLADGIHEGVNGV